MPLEEVGVVRGQQRAIRCNREAGADAAFGRKLGGVANIGVNPTTGEVEPRLEVWLFDFDEDIYGETIETDLIGFIRPEEKFDTIEAMLKVIADDAAQAREILSA